MQIASVVAGVESTTAYKRRKSFSLPTHSRHYTATPLLFLRCRHHDTIAVRQGPLAPYKFESDKDKSFKEMHGFFAIEM